LFSTKGVESKSKSGETTSGKSESNSEDIQLIKKSPLHWEIVLNRPEKYNAITRPMYERIIQILDQAAQDKQLVLLSMTGKGKFYSSGTDLADFAKMAVRFICNLFKPIFKNLDYLKWNSKQRLFNLSLLLC